MGQLWVNDPFNTEWQKQCFHYNSPSIYGLIPTAKTFKGVVLQWMNELTMEVVSYTFKLVTV